MTDDADVLEELIDRLDTLESRAMIIRDLFVEIKSNALVPRSLKERIEMLLTEWDNADTSA